MLFRSQPRCSRVYRGFLIALLLAALPLGIARAQDPNVLFIFLDDLGIEHLESYGLQDQLDPEEYAETPYLNDFAENALVFNEAWANPVCSPTRATIHTGLYGFRTGVGQIINTDATWGIDTSDVNLLPRVLGADGYATGNFGKWHMGTSDGGASDAGDQGGDGAPVVAGYDVFRGMLADNHPDFMDRPVYCEYEWTVCTADPQGGDPNCATTPFDAEEEEEVLYCSDPDDEWIADRDNYMTRRIFKEALDWIDDTENQPWFAYVALFAPHLPFHCPPDDLLGPTQPACADDDSIPAQNRPPELEMYHAMTNSVDVQIETLLGALGIDLDPPTTNWNNTYVIIASDNGSPSEVIHEPVPAGKGKGTIFQGGVRVPFMIGGPGVTARDIDDIVNLSDLYDTVLDLAGLESPRDDDGDGDNDLDSQSLVPYFNGGSPSEPREWVYTERFSPNFDPTDSDAGPTQALQTIRNDTYKYGVNRAPEQEFFYDLVTDSEWENPNILSLPTQEVTQTDYTNWGILTDELEFLVGDLLELCPASRQNEASCSTSEDCCSGHCNMSFECSDPM